LKSAGRSDTIILQGKGRGKKMWGIPDSAVYGTYKKAKHHAKKKAKASKVFRVAKDTSLHKERSVEELRELVRHAQ
jgi:ubiquitin